LFVRCSNTKECNRLKADLQKSPVVDGSPDASLNYLARIIWFYLLNLDDASLLEWRAWAEETILRIDFITPFWLCELTVAATAQTALACVRDGIGLDHADLPTDEIDEQSLLFGLLCLKFARN
jgi:hypothetical protein